MNAKFLKLCRSALAMLLAMCMVCGLIPASVFAAEGETTKYVSLGDSMTNGYGMDGYEYLYHKGDSSMTECVDLSCTLEHEVFHWANGYKQVVPDSYPARVAEHYGWELTQLAMSGMRVEDLHWILDADYTNPSAMAVAKGAWNQDAWNAAFTNGDYFTWDDIVQGKASYLYPGSSLEAMLETYQTSITEADVVSMAAGNANFGVFLMGRLQSAVGFNDTSYTDVWVDVENALRALDDSTRGYAMQAYDLVMAKVAESGMPSELAEPIVNALMYTVYSFLINYRGCLDAIVALNPDVHIVQVGLMNNMTGLKLSYQGVVYNVSEYVALAIDIVNSYMAGIATAMQMTGAYPEAQLYFMEASDVNIMSEDIPEMIKTSETIRDRFVSDIVGTESVPGMIWSALAGIVGNVYEGGELQFITLEDIERYESFTDAEKVAYAGGYMQGVNCGRNMAMSIELYLGCEDTLLDGCSLETISVDGFLSLGDLEGSGIFQPVVEDYRANIGSNSDSNFDRVISAFAAFTGMPESLIRFAYDVGQVLNGMSITEAVDSMCMLLAVRETLCHAMEVDVTVFSLLSMYVKDIMANSIGSHPSKTGHIKLYESFVSSYGSFTSEDRTMLTIDQLMRLLQEYGPEAIEEFYKYADQEGFTNAVYPRTPDSLYVALGDGSAVPPKKKTSYVNMLAEDLDVNFQNLAEEGSISGAFEIIENNSDLIAAADLITVGYGNNAFTREAVNRLMSCITSRPIAEYDWVAYVGVEGVAYVEEALQKIEAMLDENGMGEPVAALGNNSISYAMTLAVEAYAFAAVEYVFNLPKVIEAIRELNEDAVVVAIGMNNPFAGTTLTMEDTEIALETYMDYLVEGADLNGLIYAARTGNCIYVAAPDAETDTNNLDLNAITFAFDYSRNKYTGNPTTAGHEYIAEKIFNALDVQCGHIWGEWSVGSEPTCTEEGTNVRYCTLCGAEDVEMVPTVDHNYEGGVCSECGATESDIYRLKGSNRYATGLAIANELKEVQGVEKFRTVVVAYGEKFPDALTGSYLAAKYNAPILLTSESADGDVMTYIRNNLVAGGKVYILGGTAAVSSAFEEKAVAQGFDVERLKGSNRYATNLEILKEAGVDSNTEILIATGKNYADSLSASATGLPMLLVDQELTEEQIAFLQGTSKKFVILGGTAAVSADIEEALDAIGDVTRVKGKNRYETSVVIAQRYFTKPAAAVLAYGEAFPDGLCGGPLAVALGAPLILANNNALAAADAYVDGITRGYVTGGTGRLSDKTVREIFDMDPAAVIAVKD